ncbi:hypothetical protein [Marinomonas posidonica]|uniref:hypothetical protein n=1 Tax=Marinomonas posidonica TaxID=936476 RepID=UPI00373511B5
MSEYNTLYEFDASWKVTQLMVTRNLDQVQSGLQVTFAQAEQSITLVFECIDDPQNIMELMDFQQVVVSEESHAERDFSTIKVELFCDTYAEFWCDAVTKQ